MPKENQIKIQKVGENQIFVFSTLFPDEFINIKLNDQGKCIIKIEGENIVEKINDIEISRV